MVDGGESVAVCTSGTRGDESSRVAANQGIPCTPAGGGKNLEPRGVAATTERPADPSAAVLLKALRRGEGGNKSAGGGFSKTRYVQGVRQLSRWRLLIGQKRDASIKLDQQLDIERRAFLEIKHQYKSCASALERFLAREHAKSMSMLEAAEVELRLTSELSERRDELSRRYGQTRLEVYHWEETWRTVRACHRFVLWVAPPTVDEPDDQEDHHRVDEEEEDSPVRDLAATSDYEHNSSLQSLIVAFEEEANALPSSLAKTPSDLGLVEPGDLLRIYRAIEVQNLNALVQLESLGGPMAEMMSRIDEAEGRVRREINDVLEDIGRLESSIVLEERRGRVLERRCSRLVQQGFRALVCSEEVLRARILVEDAYESCIGPNVAGVEPLAMARALENTYERLSAELDLLPQHLVVTCEREGFLRELKETREAEDAARKFELMHRLLAALRRMMEPKEPKRRPLVRRSVPTGIRRKTKRGRKTARTPAVKKDVESVSAREAHLKFFEKVCRAQKLEDSGDENEEEDQLGAAHVDA